jgi:hypothetical protein
MISSRRGFALITVLWLITSLAVVVGLSMAGTRVGNQATINRIALERGRWAAEGCLAILQGRWATKRWLDSATIDLGRGVRCRWSMQDPSARVNLNTADPEILRALGLGETFVQALLIRRRVRTIDDVREAATLPGFDASLEDELTTLGDGHVNVDIASRRILLALPGMTPEAVDRILYRRSVRKPVASLENLAVELSASGRGELLNRNADLTRIVVFAPQQLVIRAEGWVEGYKPRTTVEEFVVPLPERLAVVGKRIW